MSPEQIERIEAKIDKLTEAVTHLVLVEDRQIRQGERIGLTEQRMSAIETKTAEVEKKVDKWINFGVGAWAISIVIFTVASRFFPTISGH